MKQHIVDFLKFLESRDNRKIPIVAKLLYPNKFGSLTKEDLNIEGDLNLSFTKIQSLPDNLNVKGFLDLSNTKIKSLPDNLQVGGGLDLSDTDIESLPDNLTVIGTLFLPYTPVKFIPNNLKVEGSLYLQFTPLADKMTEDEIVQEIERKGGYVWSVYTYND